LRWWERWCAVLPCATQRTSDKIGYIPLMQINTCPETVPSAVACNVTIARRRGWVACVVGSRGEHGNSESDILATRESRVARQSSRNPLFNLIQSPTPRTACWRSCPGRWTGGLSQRCTGVGRTVDGIVVPVRTLQHQNRRYIPSGQFNSRPAATHTPMKWKGVIRYTGSVVKKGQDGGTCRRGGKPRTRCRTHSW